MAQEGIDQLEQIKFDLELSDTETAYQIKEIEFNYAELMQASLEKYSDKINETKKEMKTRMTETTRSLLTNNFDKRTETEDIIKWARDEKRKIEKEHLEDVQAVRDKGIEYAKDVQASVQLNVNKELTKLDTMMENGTITNLSPEQMAALEIKL